MSRKMMTAGVGGFLFTSLLLADPVAPGSTDVQSFMQCNDSAIVALKLESFNIYGPDLLCRCIQSSGSQLPGDWSGRAVVLSSPCGP